MGKGSKVNAHHAQPSGNELCTSGVIQAQLCLCSSKVEELYLSPECVQLLRGKLTSAFDASAAWDWEQIQVLCLSHRHEGLHKIMFDTGMKGEPTNGRNGVRLWNFSHVKLLKSNCSEGEHIYLIYW